MRSSLPGFGHMPAQADAGLAEGRPSVPTRPLPSDADIHRFRQAMQVKLMDDAVPAGEEGGSSGSKVSAGSTGSTGSKLSTGSNMSTGRDDSNGSTGGHGRSDTSETHQIPQTSAAALPAGPFDLFRNNRQPDPVLEPAGVAQREALRHRLSEMVTQLLVGDGMNGARSVRMTLDEAWLPGVELSVYEEQGFWVAHFSCRLPESFVALAAPGGDMAVQLAAALNRPCLWRVEGESFPEQGEWRRHVNADGAVPLAEYRVRP